jgi:thiol-disulfide isomerase/thioredoxin
MAPAFRIRHAVVAALVLVAALGCQPSADSRGTPEPSPLPNPTAASEPAAMDSAAEAVSVEVKSWDQVQQMLADLQGQVVVIDIWSTWCVPCTIEFPHLVKLQKSHREEVTCISVAANYSGVADEPPESFREDVLGFLQRQDATFPNVISSTPDTELYEAIGTASVPVVLVYGRDGELKKKFTNDDREYGDEGFTYAEQIIPLVEQLLKEPE